MGRTTLDWIVIADPTDTFTQRLFYRSDLRVSARHKTWPDGIVFKNLVTGEQRQYAQGELLTVTSTSSTSATAEEPPREGRR
jgi:hypothetical protein